MDCFFLNMCVIIQAIWKKAVWRCEGRMHRLGKWMRALALVGQLGFCIITPPLVLVYLANLLVTKHGWGTWITIVAILFGLLCAASSAWNLIRSIHKKEQKPPEKPGVHFRDHI